MDLNNQDVVTVADFCVEHLRAFKLKEEKRRKMFRVKIDDVFLKLPSGKTVWNSKGAAKNAILNALASFYFLFDYNYRTQTYKFKYGNIQIETRSFKAFKELLKKELWQKIEFVPWN